jgi:hypothetical protein
VCGLKWVASLDSGNVHRDEFSSEVKVVLVQLLPSEKKKRTDIYRAVIFQKNNICGRIFTRKKKLKPSGAKRRSHTCVRGDAGNPHGQS